MKKILTIIAEIISYLFNPFLLVWLILLFAVHKTQMPDSLRLGWYVAVIIINGFIPAVVYFAFTRLGFVFDDSLDNKDVHKQRILLLVNLLVLVTLELLILLFTEAGQPLLAVLIGGIITILIGIVITFFWKISWHSVAATFFIAMCIFIYSWKFWYILLIIPIIMWARLYLHRHTIWQLIAGIVVALVIIFGTFEFYGLLDGLQ